MSNAYLYRMPSGIPGEVTRKEESGVEPGVLGATDVAFGAPVKVVSGKIVPIAASDTAAALYGFLVRPYPTQGGPLGLTTDGKLRAGSPCGVLRRGYLAARLASGTSAKGGAVNMRIAVDTGKAVGDLEAAATVDETVVINATFMGPADADGNVEIAYNI